MRESIIRMCGDYPLLHEIFEKTAVDVPWNISVESDEEDIKWTYTQLNDMSEHVAQLIITLGLTPDTLVGIFMPRSAYFYLCMLAILKSGGAYVSLDPEYPPDRLQHIIDDSNSRILIVDDAQLPMLLKKGWEPLSFNADTLQFSVSGAHSSPLMLQLNMPILLSMSSIREFLRLKCREPVSIRNYSNSIPPCPSNLAYAIFTSGSTGKPKGVGIEHRNVVNFVLSERLCIKHVVPSDRVLQGFSTCFDASIEEIWLAFASGATLVVGSKMLMRSGPLLCEELVTRGITVLSTVPTVLRVAEKIPAPPFLRIVITGGETCPKEVLKKWLAPGRQFYNTYGPTEASVVSTMSVMDRNDEKVTIGRGIPGYGCIIVDPESLDIIAHPGKPGELWIGGESISRGYLNRPDLNSEKFILRMRPSVDGVFHTYFCPVASEWDWTSLIGLNKEPRRHTRDFNTSLPDSQLERWYRSGDLVAWTEDGRIDFLGRIDSQVKIRGFRVELGEIESQLCLHPAVSNCCVIARSDVQGTDGDEMTLVAYLTIKNPSPLLSPPITRVPNDHCVSTQMEESRIEIPHSSSTLRIRRVDAHREQSGSAHSFSGGVTPISALPSPAVASMAIELGGNSIKSMKTKTTDDFTLTTKMLISPAAFRVHCQNALPAYMVPSRFVILPKMPLMPSGKVDRKAIEILPPPEPLTAASTATMKDFDADQHEEELENYIEMLLAALFQKELGLKSVRPSDDFFTLGGTSLTAAKVVSLQRRLMPEYPIAVRDLYETQILRALATFIFNSGGVGTLLAAEEALKYLNGDRKQPSVQTDDTSQTRRGYFTANLPVSDTEVHQRDDDEDNFSQISSTVFYSDKEGKPIYQKDLHSQPIVSRLISFFKPSSRFGSSQIGGARDSNSISDTSESSVPPSLTQSCIMQPPAVSPTASHSTNIFSRNYYSSCLVHVVSPFSRVLVQMLQLLWLSFSATLGMAWVVGYILIMYYGRFSLGLSIGTTITIMPALQVAYFWVNIFLCASAKWILLGKVKEGCHPIWSWYFLRWWCVQNWIKTVDVNLLVGTPMFPIVLRLFGAKIGSNVHIASRYVTPLCMDLLQIGSGVIIQSGTYIRAVELENGTLHLRRIIIGNEVTIGNMCFVSRGSFVESFSQLMPGTNLPPSSHIPAFQKWCDAPARFLSHIIPPVFTKHCWGNRNFIEQCNENFKNNVFNPCNSSSKSNFLSGIASLFWWIIVVFSTELVILSPRIILVLSIFRQRSYPLIFTILIGLSFWSSCVGPTLFTILARWILFPRKIQLSHSDGSIARIHSFWYMRFWALKYVLHRHQNATHPMYSTVYTSSFLRLLGARLGKGVEISDAMDFTPDFLSIGANCFVADAVSLCPHVITRKSNSAHCFVRQQHDQQSALPPQSNSVCSCSKESDYWVSLDELQLGDRTFLGNNSLAMPGSRIGSDNLVGVASVAPGGLDEPIMHEIRSNSRHPTNANHSFLGSVPFTLPNRAKVIGDANLTFNPPFRLRILRGFIEILRIILPSTISEYSFILLWMFYDLILFKTLIPQVLQPNVVPSQLSFFSLDIVFPPIQIFSYSFVQYLWPIIVFPMFTCAYGLLLAISVLFIKWTVVGKHKSGTEMPLWSIHVWLAELCTALNDDCFYKFFGRSLGGSCLMPFWFKLLGSKIGRRVYLDSPFLLEFDLVELGDDCIINENATLQTHLFEDRVMKLGIVKIGRRCSIGVRAVVLYSTAMQKDAQLQGMSLMMKGESFASKQVFGGVPAVPLQAKK